MIVFPSVTGWGDLTYNSRRSILGAIPVAGRITYHLFTINNSALNAGGIVKLNRKSKWHSQYSPENGREHLFITIHLFIKFNIC